MLPLQDEGPQVSGGSTLGHRNLLRMTASCPGPCFRTPTLGFGLHLLNFSQFLGPLVPPRLCCCPSLLPSSNRGLAPRSPPAKCSRIRPAHTPGAPGSGPETVASGVGGQVTRGMQDSGPGLEDACRGGSGSIRPGKPVPPWGRESQSLPGRAKGPHSRM